jgi:hypothetical protein
MDKEARRVWQYQTWEALVERFGREGAADRLAWLMPSAETVRDMARFAEQRETQLGERCSPDPSPLASELRSAYQDAAEDLEDVAQRVDVAVAYNVRGSFG